MKASLSAEKQQIRKQMREQRNALSRHDQHQAAAKLAKLIKRQALFQRCRRISFYLANDGEIDPFHLMVAAHTMRKSCFLPAVKRDSSGKLDFVRYLPDSKLIANQYGIPEPVANRDTVISPKELDLVLMPLVAFDANGGRLGMGAGYYDRTFAFKSGGAESQPKLIGLAHDFQCLPELPLDDWDIPMHAVITESRIFTRASTTESDPYQHDFLARDRYKTPGDR